MDPKEVDPFKFLGSRQGSSSLLRPPPREKTFSFAYSTAVVNLFLKASHSTCLLSYETFLKWPTFHIKVCKGIESKDCMYHHVLPLAHPSSLTKWGSQRPCAKHFHHCYALISSPSFQIFVSHHAIPTSTHSSPSTAHQHCWTLRFSIDKSPPAGLEDASLWM